MVHTVEDSRALDVTIFEAALCVIYAGTRKAEDFLTDKMRVVFIRL